MARNRFDVDETLETPFNIKHLLRAGVYIKRHKQKMILSLVFSAISAACALVGPKLIETALNVAVPNRDYKMLFILAGIMLLSILLSIFFSRPGYYREVYELQNGIAGEKKGGAA